MFIFSRQVQTLERNELIITVGSCAKLKPAFEGKIPSVYVVYQFSEYPEQDTVNKQKFILVLIV